jgi:hypothetical protein
MNIEKKMPRISRQTINYGLLKLYKYFNFYKNHGFVTNKNYVDTEFIKSIENEKITPELNNFLKKSFNVYPGKDYILEEYDVETYIANLEEMFPSSKPSIRYDLEGGWNTPLTLDDSIKKKISEMLNDLVIINHPKYNKVISQLFEKYAQSEPGYYQKYWLLRGGQFQQRIRIH